MLKTLNLRNKFLIFVVIVNKIFGIISTTNNNPNIFQKITKQINKIQTIEELNEYKKENEVLIKEFNNIIFEEWNSDNNHQRFWLRKEKIRKAKSNFKKIFKEIEDYILKY